MTRIETMDVFKPATTDLCVGLIGAGIQGSLSPAMHMREGSAHGLTYDYRLIDLEPMGLPASALPELIEAAEQAGFHGVNITFPCKQTVIPLLHELSDEARTLGAVNTVVLRGGRRIGHNTDWWGFAEAFKRDLGDVARGSVVQVGAGGAGAAVAHALMTLGVERLAIADTDPAKGEALAQSVAARFPDRRAVFISEVARAAAQADGIVNATPVGMAKYPGLPIATDFLRPACWIADVIYFPLATELIRQARARGCRTMTGGGMAVFQAVRAFELLSGRTADPARMERHFAELTGQTQI